MTKTVALPPSIDYALIIQVAKSVSRYREWMGSISEEQAFEIAYDAINSHVMRGEILGDNPLRFLAFLGRRAVRTHLSNRVGLRSNARMEAEAIEYPYGDNSGPRSWVPDGLMKPRFARYWTSGHGYAPDSASDIDERVALHQALGGLEAEQREDLEALASTFDGARAAKLRGVGRVHFVKRCRRARLAFFALWYEGETPPPLPRRVVNRA